MRTYVLKINVPLNYATRSAHTRFFEGMIAPLRSSVGEGHIEELSARLAEFLVSDRVRERTDDDVSILVASYANC
jgi:hypothetical protein